MHAMNMYFIFFRRVLTPHSSRSHRRRIHTLCMWECHGLCVLFPAIDITTLLIMYVIVLRPFFLFLFVSHLRLAEALRTFIPLQGG